MSVNTKESIHYDVYIHVCAINLHVISYHMWCRCNTRLFVLYMLAYVMGIGVYFTYEGILTHLYARIFLY